MVKVKRDLGQEILQRLRQLRWGGHGRVITLPSITSIREKIGLSQARFAELLGVRTNRPGMGAGPPGAFGRRPDLVVDCR